MKKILPILLLIIGVLVVVGVFLFMRNKKAPEEIVEEENGDEVVAEISIEKRPVVSLTPSSDGHWLKFEVKKIVLEAATLDYEMTYKVPDGRTQGVPGTVKLTSTDDISKDLLLGSESSGKFRYDEGVENGNLILRFRNSDGKLVAKFETEFLLLSDVTEIPFSAGKNFKPDKKDSKIFFVTMNTFGYPGDAPSTPSQAFGIFSSSAKPVSGVIEEENAYLWNKEKWVKIEDGKSPDIGYFIVL